MSEVPESPLWVDFHCHLDLYRDHQDLIRECDAEKILTLGVTTTPKAFARNAEMALGYPYALVGLGLHPQLVAERANELPLFEKLLPRTRYVGEIGLDAGPRFYPSFQEQQRVFERILRVCDEQGGKVMSMHSVRTVSKVLDAMEIYMPNRTCVPILHWFTGTPSEMSRAVEQGCYFSVNIEMLASKKLRPLLIALPADRLLTETDGPFVQFEDRVVRPTDIPITVAVLAKLRGIDVGTLARQITNNLSSVLAAPLNARIGEVKRLRKPP